MNIKLALTAIGLLSAGCALAPNSIRPEVEHMSHVTQHFGAQDSKWPEAVNIAQLTAHWDLPKRFYVEVSDGVALNGPANGGGYGEIAGPREEFTARIGYVFKIH